MKPFKLDPRLAADTHYIHSIADIDILLMDNALYPWFILVPHTPVIELYQLDEPVALALNRLINTLSRFVIAEFPVEKLNVAAIGNIVSQLHVHVVGRRTGDPAWPGVVWGSPYKAARTEDDVSKIKTSLTSALCKLTTT